MRTSGALVSDLERLVFHSFLFLGFLLTQCYPSPLIVLSKTPWLIVSWAVQNQRLDGSEGKKRHGGPLVPTHAEQQLKQE